MKHGKKPSVRQAQAITNEGHDYCDWLVIKDSLHSMIIVHRTGGAYAVISK